MVGTAGGLRGGDRYYTAFVTVPDQSLKSRGQLQRKWRVVASSLVVSIAVVAVLALYKGPVVATVFTEKQVGQAAKAEQMKELGLLAALSAKHPKFVKRGTKLVWLNAGALPDNNVFDQPKVWKAPDDPARPQPPKSKDDYTTLLHPEGGLDITHSTDNGSPAGDSFGIDRSADDIFHGSAPAPPPTEAGLVAKIPQGDQFVVTSPTDTGMEKSHTFTAFTIDTSTDDFFTHHANPAAQCFEKVDDKYFADWMISKTDYKKDEAMSLCSVTKDCNGITKQEGYFGGTGWTLRKGKVPMTVISPSGTIDTDLDLSRSCGDKRNKACAASQSTTDAGATADRANDGVLSTKFSDGSCSKTLSEKNPYWVEDLEKPRRITSLKVYGHDGDDANLLEGFRVRAGLKPDVKAPSHFCAVNQPAPTADSGWITEVKCDPPVEGQYLWIEIPGLDRVLSLCGVVVKGTELDDGPADSYKYICDPNANGRGNKN